MALLRVGFAAAVFWIMAVAQLQAVEPNNTFADRTILGPGVHMVMDTLDPTSALFPDTVLGSRGLLGGIEQVNDDGSELGEGSASALSQVSVNSNGVISFAVSGYPDLNFVGNHSEEGDFKVFVDVYDLFGDLIESFSDSRTLLPGAVEEFNYSGDASWLNGTYDVNIDNSIAAVDNPADVDFFTFTELPVGAVFAVEVTQDPYVGLDTVLGWFDDNGQLIANDDDGGTDLLSRIVGSVPDSGEVTIAVSGYRDFNFTGVHPEQGEYILQLSVESVEANGDYDGDGDVDGRDFLLWQRGESPMPLSVGDLQAWQENYGTNAPAAVAAVPEPATVGLLALAAYLYGLRRRPIV